MSFGSFKVVRHMCLNRSYVSGTREGQFRIICIYSYCLNNNCLYMFVCLFAQSHYSHMGLLNFCDAHRERKVLTGVEENQVSLGESQLTYLPVYLPGGFMIKIYEVSDCEQEWLDCHSKTWSLLSSQKWSMRSWMFVMYPQNLYFIKYLKRKLPKLLYKLWLNMCRIQLTVFEPM